MDLTFEHINKLTAQLREQLPRLMSGDIHALEYGEADKPSGAYLSYLRIYYMNTAGGYQFGIKTLLGHMEHSGHYCPDVEPTVALAMNAVLHYHRNTGSTRFAPSLSRGQKNQPELNWFVPRPEQLATSINLGAAHAQYNLSTEPWDCTTIVKL